MVVLVIVSVILAVTTPRLANFYDSIKLDNSARQLRLFYLYGENTVLSKRKRCKIFYSHQTRTFTLKIEQNHINDPEIFKKVEGNSSIIKLLGDIRLAKAQESGALPVPPDTDFDFEVIPLGNPKSYCFTLENKNKEKINVIVEAGSGFVKIVKLPVSTS